MQCAVGHGLPFILSKKKKNSRENWMKGHIIIASIKKSFSHCL